MRNNMALFLAALIGACGTSQRTCENDSECFSDERCVSNGADLVCVAFPDAAVPQLDGTLPTPDGPVATPDGPVATPDAPSSDGASAPDAETPQPDAEVPDAQAPDATEPDGPTPSSDGASAPDAETPQPDAEVPDAEVPVPDALVPTPECTVDADCGPCGHCTDGDCSYDPVVTLYRDADNDGYGDEAISIEVCEQLGGWSVVAGDCDDNNDAVYPGATELCNGLDDNCDDAVDGLTVGAGLPCGTTDVGVCSFGAVVCANGELICVGAVEPTAEVCDNADNDCNGALDNGIATTLTTCGAGVCASQGTLSCFSGQMVDSCVSGTPSAEVCDSADNDCDGEVDEGQPVFVSLCGAGVCERTGMVSCVDGQFTDTCTPGQPLAADDSSCNSMDEDCNGAVDEDYASLPTTCGVGGCASTGTTSCVAGAVADSCMPSQASVEVFNGLDDDCDGATDEGFACEPGATQSCGPTAEVGTCQFGTQFCVSDSGGSLWTECFNAVLPAAEVCDNADNDCNGTTDDGLGSTPTTCGTGACSAIGTLSCQGGQMVDSCTPGAFSTEICEGSVDEDCDGAVDNGCACVNGITQQCGPPTDVGECTFGTQTCTDGAWGVCQDAVNSVAEICDGLDNNCNGLNDDGVQPWFYKDSDGDGFGNPFVIRAIPMSGGQCSPPPGTVANNTDCNDASASVHPGATETCGDGVDQDCNGSDLACPVTATVTWTAPTGFVLDDIRHDLAGGWVEQSLATTPTTHTLTFTVQPGTTYKVNARLRNPITLQVLYLAQFTTGFSNNPPCSGVSPVENGDLTFMVGTTAVVCSVASDPASGSCVANEFCTP